MGARLEGGGLSEIARHLGVVIVQSVRAGPAGASPMGAPGRRDRAATWVALRRLSTVGVRPWCQDAGLSVVVNVPASTE